MTFSFGHIHIAARFIDRHARNIPAPVLPCQNEPYGEPLPLSFSS